MKLTVVETQVECTAEELRQSNTVADGLLNVFRRAFNGPVCPVYHSTEEDNDEEED